MSARVLQQLRDIVGPGQVIVEPDMMAPYGIDWTGRFVGTPTAVVRPGDSREVAAVVEVCSHAGTALVPQGGNTGLVGGSVPLEREIVLSLRRLAGVSEVDALGGQLSAGAGTTVADVQVAAEAAGWAYGVDLGSRESATIGGTVATNAGGLQVLRHGATRAQLLGCEAVLGTGETISHMGGLVKDNTGYDLGGLLCGSEGTLGVVTAVRLRLVPPAPERVTAILAFSSTAAAVDAASLLRRSLPELLSLELFLQGGLDLVCRVTGIGPPFVERHAVYLLAEAAAQCDPLPAMADIIGSVVAVEDVAVATDASRRAHLWRYREGHTEAINTLGAPHKLDVTLPAPLLAAFIDDVPDIVKDADPLGRDMVVRSCRRWQRACQRHRCRPGRSDRRRPRPHATSRRSAAASAPNTASGRPSGLGSTSTGVKPSSMPSAQLKSALDPCRHHEPQRPPGAAVREERAAVT